MSDGAEGQTETRTENCSVALGRDRSLEILIRAISAGD